MNAGGGEGSSDQSRRLVRVTFHYEQLIESSCTIGNIRAKAESRESTGILSVGEVVNADHTFRRVEARDNKEVEKASIQVVFWEQEIVEAVT